MSKIGKRPIQIAEGVAFVIENGVAFASNGEKKLEYTLPHEVEVKISGDIITVTRIDDSKAAKERHGLVARLLANMIQGVKSGYEKELIFTGTGYRAAIVEGQIVLAMGYSHDVKLDVPADLEVKVVKNSIHISGIDKQHVGQFAAVVRGVRPPEPYKGKGIKYKEEKIRRKAGKTAASK